MIVSDATQAVTDNEYITVEMYFVKAKGIKYISQMYTDNKVAYDVVSWGTTRGTLTIYDKTWTGVVSATTKRVGYYEMDGSVAENLETGRWYKIAIPKMKDTSQWAMQCKLEIKCEDGAAEVYFRNVSYGNTLPEGWVNA